jgi:ATP-binding protein involved in chromosome partitioning
MQLEGAVLVTTPQDIARVDTAKALAMFQQADVRVLGVVRNMTGFLCPHCGQSVEIFPQSDQIRSALDELLELASVPLDPAAVVNGDHGRPVVISMPDSPVTRAFLGLAERIATLVPIS